MQKNVREKFEFFIRKTVSTKIFGAEKQAPIDTWFLVQFLTAHTFSQSFF